MCIRDSKMPFGATALDFAYDIHSKIGNSAISAKINHKLEPIAKMCIRDRFRADPCRVLFRSFSAWRKAFRGFPGRRRHGVPEPPERFPPRLSGFLRRASCLPGNPESSEIRGFRAIRAVS